MNGLMQAVHKYQFDLSFDHEEEKRRLAQEEALADDARRQEEFAAKIDAARKDAWQKGHEAGEARGREKEHNEQHSVAAQALDHMAKSLPEIAARQEGALQDNLRDTLAVAVTLVDKFFPAFSARHGLAEIESLLLDCLSRLVDEPRILVRVHPDMCAPLTSRIESVVKTSAYEGRIIVRAGEDMDAHGCRIAWQAGSIERDPERMWQEVGHILQGYINLKDIKGTTDNASLDPLEAVSPGPPADAVDEDIPPSGVDAKPGKTTAKKSQKPRKKIECSDGSGP